MPTVAYKLTSTSAFHFGREGLAQHASSESLPSDSFFSALIATSAKVNPNAIDGIIGAFPPFISTPPLRISSLFPIAGDLPLFPKPRIEVQRKLADDGQLKKIKRIQYVSVGILKLLLKGEAMDKSLGENGLFLQNGVVWLQKSEQSRLPVHWHKHTPDMLNNENVWDVQLAPRVSVDRMTTQSNVYQVGRTVFSKGCGLWFMADVSAGNMFEWLEDMLTHLVHEGLGGERSAGYGSFELSKIPVPIPPSQNSPYAMLISRYNPNDRELINGVIDAQCAYDLVDVGGWVGSQKRARVRFFEVGSVLKGGLAGQLVDVSPQNSPQHRIFRSGIALTLGIERIK